jgi:hypothetical protein
MTAVDDATAAYILETRKAFEDLRQIAAQLSGLLVLEAAGAKSELPHHPMLAAAGELWRGANETARSASPTACARRHHEHLLAAAALLRDALSAAGQSLAIDPILVPLRAAYSHLQAAGHELPGFEMVAFAQGCCARPSRVTA